jgi:hypothetical protein
MNSAEEIPRSLLRGDSFSSGEFLIACFDKIDEFRKRDTLQLSAGLFIFWISSRFVEPKRGNIV